MQVEYTDLLTDKKLDKQKLIKKMFDVDAHDDSGVILYPIYSVIEVSIAEDDYNFFHHLRKYNISENDICNIFGAKVDNYDSPVIYLHEIGFPTPDCIKRGKTPMITLIYRVG
jgi:hypothetical protein